MTTRPCKTLTGWKVSRYLTRVDLTEADTMLLYGGIASRLVEVPGSFREEAEALLADPNSTCVSNDSKLRNLLQEQGILIPETFDELVFLKKGYERVRSLKSGTLGLTLCPTLECNFRCTYCYQHHPSRIMSASIQEKVVRFVKKHDPRVNALSVTWFGGEPLIGLTVIERLSRQFMDLRDGKIKYKASIVTNGWLLKPSVSRLLADLKVGHVQVTLDGPRAIHNRRRPLKGKRPSFDTIVENIAEADRRLRITVRVNVDRNNAGFIPLLFQQLDAAGLKGRITLYFASVYPYTNVCADVEGSCLMGQNWAKLQGQLQFDSLEHGYGGFGLPESMPHHCIADNDQGWVISPDGLVFKCWNDVTQPENAVFDLSTARQTRGMRKVSEQWMSWNPFNLNECIDCQVLPHCMGGCPALGLQQEGPYVHGHCKEAKYNLQERLAIYYLAFKRKEAIHQLMGRLREWIPEVITDREGVARGKMGPELAC